MTDDTTIKREESARAEREAKGTGYVLLHSGMALKLAQANALPVNALGAIIGCLSQSGPQKFRRACCLCGRSIAQTEKAAFAKGTSYGAIGAVNVCVRGTRGTKGTVQDGCYETLQMAYATRALTGTGIVLPA